MLALLFDNHTGGPALDNRKCVNAQPSDTARPPHDTPHPAPTLLRQMVVWAVLNSWTGNVASRSASRLVASCLARRISHICSLRPPSGRVTGLHQREAAQGECP